MVAPRPANSFIKDNGEGWTVYHDLEPTEIDLQRLEKMITNNQSVTSSSKLLVNKGNENKEYLFAYVTRTRAAVFAADKDLLTLVKETNASWAYCLTCNKTNPDYFFEDEEIVGLADVDQIYDTVYLCEDCMQEFINSIQESEHSPEINRELVAENI